MEKNSGEAGKDLFLLTGERCPECHEVITPADVENFPRCPYCDHSFANDEALEDFILKPVLQRWVNHNFQQFSR